MLCSCPPNPQIGYLFASIFSHFFEIILQLFLIFSLVQRRLLFTLQVSFQLLDLGLCIFELGLHRLQLGLVIVAHVAWPTKLLPRALQLERTKVVNFNLNWYSLQIASNYYNVVAKDGFIQLNVNEPREIF